MRKSQLAFGLLALTALALVAWFVRSREAAQPAEPNSVATSPAVAPSDAPEIVGGLASELAPSETREAVSEPAPAAAPAREPHCVLRGRVVDEHDAPLAGVAIELYSYKRWSAEHEGPPLARDARLRGWNLATDESGEFVVTAPVPDAAGIQALELVPDPFHDKFSLRFGRDGRAALAEGVTDLGTLRLATTGALEGHVRDARGQPLAKASVRVATARETTVGRETTTDEAGHFLLGHVQPGTWGVACKLEGYLSLFQQPFEVAPTSTTAGLVLTLRDSPTISGRVVDTAGVPQAGLRVGGWPESSGSGTGATTDVDGNFTLFLPQDEPYRLEVKLDTIDSSGIGDEQTHYAPGTRGLTLVVPESIEVAVAVVAAETGAPVEAFGFRIERGEIPGVPAALSGRRSVSKPQPTPQPGGTLRVRVRPGDDSYLVVATGYDDATGKFGAELASAPELQIRLVRGKALRGRAVRAGQPLEAVVVTLQPGIMILRGEGTEPTFSPDRNRRPQSVRTDAQGRFELLVTESDRTVRVSLVGPDGASASQVVSTKNKESLDLGDIELLAAGSIVGTLAMPQGRSPSGVLVYLNSNVDGSRATADGEGQFRFESVMPGKHQLFVGELPGRVTKGGPFPIEVRAGEVASTTLDLRELGTCDVELFVRFSNGPAEGWRVALFPTQGGRRSHDFGFVDASSRVASWAPAWGATRIQLRSPKGQVWTHPTEVLQLELDAHVRADVTFDVASLSIELPSGFRLPESARVSLDFVTADGGQLVLHLQSDGSGDDLRLEGSRLRCPRVLAGELELALRILDPGRVPEPIEVSPGRFSMRAEPVLERRAVLRLPSGQETHWRLE